MKKIIALLVLIAFAFLSIGCGQPKTIDGVTYDTYGLFNESTKKNPNIKYEISVGNVILSIFFVETIIVPIYFVGFDIFNPIGPNDNTFVPGKI